MSNTKRKKKLIFKFVTIALVIIFCLSGALILVDLWEKNRENKKFSNYEEVNDSVKIFDGKEYVRKENIETFLVIGLDKNKDNITSDSYNNDQSADFLMLFVYDNDKKECKALHINRDTMAKMNVLGVAGDKVYTVTKQIALAHTYGKGGDISCNNTVNSVSELLLNEKISHYVSVTMDTFVKYNDYIGGVEVEVLDDFSGIDDTLIKGEKVLLKGEHALNYVRTRKDLEDSSNDTRMKRQKQYIEALQKKVKECIQNDADFILKAPLKEADYIYSDRSINQLKELANKMFEYEFIEVEGLKGETKMGEKYLEFYPDEDSINSVVKELFYQPK